MPQISKTYFPVDLDAPVASVDGDSLPGVIPPGGDDLNLPFIPDEDPKDGEPAPQTEGPLSPDPHHEDSRDA